MRKYVGFLIFCLLLASVLGFLYYQDQSKPKAETYELSVRAEYKGQAIRTGMMINGENYTLNGYELLNLSGLVTLQNYNILNQSYYTRTEVINLTEKTRYDFILEKPEEVQITSKGLNPIEVNFKGSIKQPIVCLAYSFAYFKVKINELEIRKPERFNSYDRCYQLEDIENNKTILVEWSKYSEPKETDFINISIANQEFPQLDKTLKIK
jgi:hypothetical protein